MFPTVRHTDYFHTFFLAGKLRKIRNHVAQFGSTGAMATAGSCLVSAGYDLDRGNGYLNGKQQCSMKLIFVAVQVLEIIFDAEQILTLRFLQMQLCETLFEFVKSSHSILLSTKPYNIG